MCHIGKDDKDQERLSATNIIIAGIVFEYIDYPGRLLYKQTRGRFKKWAMMINDGRMGTNVCLK